MDIVTHRRNLHRIPELDRQLPKTLAYLEQALEPFCCRLLRPMEGALAAFFDFGRETAIAFRADADALPIQETTGAEYASCHFGQMHACGHDGHMAILLELARRLSEKKELPHNVLLLFQPAEETTGGAADLCRTGILEEYAVQGVFGLHLWPGLPAGTIASRPGELMARSSEVDVDIQGKSAHIAKAAQGIDALYAGMEVYRRAWQLERDLPEGIFRLLKFGKLTSGTVRNALSAHTHMEGSLRAFQDEIFDGLAQGLRKIGEDVAAETGCKISVTFSDGYPAVMNPADLARKVMAVAPYQLLPEPSMTAEDFAFYQKHLPAMFFFLGLGDVPALHRGDFDFDEGILQKGADFFEALAEGFV